MPCLLRVITYLVHSLAELILMPSSSVHTGVGWLASSLLLMISFTVLALGCLRKCVTQPTASITSCHPSNLRIMPCETVASPTSCLIVTISSIRIGMRAAYSFKHPLFSDNVEFCGWVCLSVCLSVRTVFKMLLLFVFSYCMFIFLYCFVCQYRSSDWL